MMLVGDLEKHRERAYQGLLIAQLEQDYDRIQADSDAGRSNHPDPEAMMAWRRECIEKRKADLHART